MPDMPADPEEMLAQDEEWLKRLTQTPAARRRRNRTRSGGLTARFLPIDWDQLAFEVGIVTQEMSVGGTMTYSDSSHARRAIELLIGSDNIRDAVGLIVRSELNRTAAIVLAERILRLIRSQEATDLAYQAYHAYRSIWAEGAVAAVGLIADIAHPKALNWVEEFLSDGNVVHAGVAVLDQLVGLRQVDLSDERVKLVLQGALHHSDENVRARAQKISLRLERSM